MRKVIESVLSAPKSFTSYFRKKDAKKKDDDATAQDVLSISSVSENEFAISTQQIIKDYFNFIFSPENRLQIAGASLLTIAITVFSILAPYYFGLIIETLSQNKQDGKNLESESEIPLQTIFYMTAMSALVPLLSTLREQLLSGVAAHNTQKIIERASDHKINHTSLAAHVNTPESKEYFLLNTAFSVSKISTPVLTQIIPKLVELMIASIGLSMEYGSSIGISVFMMAIAFTIYTKKTAPLLLDAKEKMNTVGQATWRTLSYPVAGYKTIHDCGKSKEALAMIHDATLRAKGAELQVVGTPLKISLGHIVIANLSMFFMFALNRKNFTPSSFAMMFAYLTQLSNSILGAGHALGDIFTKYPDIAIVFREFAKASEVIDSGTEILDVSHGANIKFYRIQFVHPASKKTLFHDISFTINPGETVAIVSSSGAGKSTLFNLLYRYYTPSGGGIYINGHNIADVTLPSLRSNICVVGQHANLFSGSVRENIQFGSDITDEAIFELAEKLNLVEFICGLSDAQTNTMESFSRGLDRDAKPLSGGEQQKVAILRGFFKHAPIRLLDEITSSLDAESAHQVMTGVKKISDEHTTTLIITHKLSEIMDVDKIIVLENGCVSAIGTHRELLSQCDLYRTLWMQQNSHSIVADKGMFGTRDPDAKTVMNEQESNQTVAKCEAR